MNLDSLQTRRTWIVGCAVIALLVVAASWFLVILPKRSDAADTRAESRDNDLTRSSLIAKHGVLARQAKNIAGLRIGLAAALVALPPTTALPEFTHEATQAAATTSVTLQNINVGSLAPVTTATAAPQAPAASESSSTATPNSDSAPASAPSAATQYQLSITLTTGGPFKNQLAFLRAIENGPRRALVTSTSFTGAGSKTVLTSQLTIFTAPMSVQQVAKLRTLLATG